MLAEALPSGTARRRVTATYTDRIAGAGGHWLYLRYLGFAVWAVFLTASGAALLLSGHRREGIR